MDWLKERDADDAVISSFRQYFLAAIPNNTTNLLHQYEGPEARRPVWFVKTVRQYILQPYSVVVHKQTSNTGTSGKLLQHVGLLFIHLN